MPRSLCTSFPSGPRRDRTARACSPSSRRATNARPRRRDRHAAALSEIVRDRVAGLRWKPARIVLMTSRPMPSRLALVVGDEGHGTHRHTLPPRASSACIDDRRTRLLADGRRLVRDHGHADRRGAASETAGLRRRSPSASVRAGEARRRASSALGFASTTTSSDLARRPFAGRELRRPPR